MEPSAFQDPFAAADETQHRFTRPAPGGRTAAPVGNPAVPGAAPDTDAPESGLNPLVAAAHRLLVLIPQLRNTRSLADPAALRDSLARGLRDFSARAAAAGVAAQHVTAARYVLCTALDEAAADTPWGGSGVWAQNSLAAMFHNDVRGGEKVFQLMARLAEKPSENLHLLELVYFTLALGFEGRWRVVDNGRAQLDAVRDKLAQIVRRERGDTPRALAQHWQGEPRSGKAPNRVLPLAATAAVSALLLVSTLLALQFSLAAYSDPVHSKVLKLRLSAPVISAPVPAPQPRLAQFLQSDIKAGDVAVRDEVDRSVVTIRGDGTFASGSATLLPEHQALVSRVANALAQVSGRVLVIGHTDDRPIARSARFPSNWHLSEARARTVADLLVAHKVAADRINAEGRAAEEPIVANDSPGNRALNRRVEITLLIGRGPK